MSSLGLEAALNLKPLDSSLTLGEISDSDPMLLVLLRHSGCTFCRAHLNILAKERHKFLGSGVKLALVMMSEAETIKKMVSSYYGYEALLVSDPQKILYTALGAKQGKINNIIGYEDLRKAFFDGWLFKYGVGWPDADVTQLGGTYLIHKRRVLFAEPARSSSEICSLEKVLSN